MKKLLLLSFLSFSAVIVNAQHIKRKKTSKNHKSHSGIYHKNSTGSSNLYNNKQESESTSIGSQKFCYDDTYGYSGMKLEITLVDDGSARLDYKKDGVIKRSGSAKWRETDGTLYLFLSSGSTLEFETLKNLSRQTYMLTDSRGNQYMECY